MQFQIHCACGAELKVTAADAGSSKRCRCGAQNQVPSLSELRRQAGQDRYATSTVDKIRQMVSDGRLPGSKTCERCSCQTLDVLTVSIECERPYVKRSGYWATVIAALLAPLWMVGLLLRDYGQTEVHGNDVVVDVPLAVCSDCAAALQHDQKSAIELVRSVAIYNQLLQEYPDAAIVAISVSGPARVS